MRIITPLLCVMCLTLGTTAFAQHQTKTDVNTDIDVTKVYEQVVEEGYGTPEVYLRLANEYYFAGNYRSAKKWFEQVFKNNPPTDKKILFRYKQTLKALNVTPDNNPYLAVTGGTN